MEEEYYSYSYQQLERITLQWLDKNFENIPPEVRTYFFAKAFTAIETRSLPEEKK